MDTNELIDALARDLKPVRPLLSPFTRALLFSAVAAALVALVVIALGGPRTAWGPDAIRDTELMSLAGLISAAAAFRLAVPDVRARKRDIALLGLAVMVWAAYCMQALMAPDVHLQAEPAAPDCLAGLAALSVLPLSLGLWMVWRACPVWRGLAGAAAWLSAASFAAAGMRFLCANDSLGHLLLWHFMPVLALGAIGAVAGRFLFRRL